MSLVLVTVKGVATTVAFEKAEVPLVAIVAIPSILPPVVEPAEAVNVNGNDCDGFAGRFTVVLPRGARGNRCGGKAFVTS